MMMIEPAQVTQTALTILLPKNLGLVAQVERALERRVLPTDAGYVRVRGEDVPLLADQLARAGRCVLALTGDDLLDEWLSLGNTLSERIVRDRIAWNDPSAIYGAPALCLIGRATEAPATLQPTRRVAVCTRYRALAERYLLTLGQDGVGLETMVVNGAVENFVTSGVADFAIDIVVTGKTLQRSGLAVKRVISTSDVAVLETR
jgi:ATP phosphoribosyltransferase